MAIRKADKTNWYINDSFVCWDERVSNWFCGECWRYGCSHVQELREHLTKRVPDEKPAGASFMSELLAAFLR